MSDNQPDPKPYEWLSSAQGAEAWAQMVRSCGSLPNGCDASAKLVLKQQFDFATALAKRKVSDSFRWFWTRLLLEQASDEWTAKETAADFPHRTMVIDGCCGAGVDAVALGGGLACQTNAISDAVQRELIPIDRSIVSCFLTRMNGSSHRLTWDPMELPFEEFTLPKNAWLHIDPDRRAEGGRSVALAGIHPKWDAIADKIANASGASIKMAPGFQPESNMEWGVCGAPNARRWISREGSVRQQRLYWRIPRWGSGVRIVSASQTGEIWNHEAFPESEAETKGYECIDSDRSSLNLGGFIADQDPALRASGCSIALARRLNIRILGNQFGYFHADSVRAHPMLRWFQVLDVMPMDRKKLKAMSRTMCAKRWELKSRNIDADLEKVRGGLLVDPNSQIILWLLLTRVGDRQIAIVAREVDKVGVEANGN